MCSSKYLSQILLITCTLTTATGDCAVMTTGNTGTRWHDSPPNSKNCEKFVSHPSANVFSVIIRCSHIYYHKITLSRIGLYTKQSFKKTSI
jgi:hypothetical protein